MIYSAYIQTTKEYNRELKTILNVSECWYILYYSFHTQSRTDRDQYVIVNYDNIGSNYHPQYNIVQQPVCSDYDCRSMMHYCM